MKVKLKTTFDRYGEYVTGHIEDVEMYKEVKKGIRRWKDTVYSRITHIRIPKEVFERLLDLEGEQTMSKEKIEEMAKDLCQNGGTCSLEEWNDCELAVGEYCEKCKRMAERLIAKGYRKQSEGKWVLEKEPNGKPYCFHCSVCDDEFRRIDIKVKYPYCPYCGARMKGE